MSCDWSSASGVRDPVALVSSVLVQAGACAWGWYALKGEILFDSLCGAHKAHIVHKAIGLAALYRAIKHATGPNWKQIAMFDER